MAYENINWGMIPSAKQNEQNMFLQMIGQGIANYQEGKDRQLRERQMDMQANKAPDFKDMAMGAVYKQQMGMPITPEEQAAIGTMAATSAPRQYTDELGRVITQPSPWQLLTGTQGNTGLGQGTNPAINKSYDNIQPVMGGDILAGEYVEPMPNKLERPDALPPVLTREQFDEKKGLVAPELPEQFIGTPVGEKMAYETQKEYTLKEWERDTKAAEAELKTEKGRNTVGSILDRMDQLNDQLKQREGIVVGGQPMKDRIQAFISSSGVGQAARKVLDPETQALAEEYRNLQATLLPFYASAAGLGAKSLDSEGERKSILDSFGSPSGIYQANQRQINNLRSTFGLEQKDTGMIKSGGQSTSTNNRPSITREQAIEILRQRGKL